MRILIPVLVFSCFASLASAAGISGNVVDMTTGKGIPGVKVTLHTAEGRKVADVVTNGMGVYNFRMLDKGAYHIRIEPTGYRPDPDTISNQKAENDPDKAPPCELWPLAATRNQLMQGGAMLANKASEDKTGKTYADFWKKLGPGEMPPLNKYFIITGIKEVDRAADDKWKPFRHYLGANPAAIDKVQALFNGTILGDSMPTTGTLADFRLDDIVVADIVAFELRNSRLSMDDKEAFVASYRKNMGKSGSVIIIDNWLKDSKKSKFELP